MSTIHILIVATAISSSIVAITGAISTLFNRKPLRSALNLFIYSFSGGLLGAFIGSIIGVAIGYVVVLITDYR